MSGVCVVTCVCGGVYVVSVSGIRVGVSVCGGICSECELCMCGSLYVLFECVWWCVCGVSVCDRCVLVIDTRGSASTPPSRTEKDWSQRKKRTGKRLVRKTSISIFLQSCRRNKDKNY